MRCVLQNLLPKQLLLLTSTLVLVLGASTAIAQNKGGGGFAPPGFYTGTETSPGTYDPVSGMRWGQTFVLNSFGEWETYHLTVSIDYATNQFVPNNLIVTSGNWNLVVVRDNAYAGTLYGDVSGGSVLLVANIRGEIITQQTQANLRSTGNMGIFAGMKRSNISGVFTGTTDLSVHGFRETTGGLPLTF